MEHLVLSFLNFLGLTSVLSRRSVQQEDLVLARLTKLATTRMEPEVSEAWNERRIIRRRLQAYGSK